MKSRSVKWFFILFELILLLCLSFYCGYYFMRQNQVSIADMEGYSITSDSEDMIHVGREWIDDYLSQFQQHFLKPELVIKSYEIEDIALLEDNVVSATLTLSPQQLSEFPAASLLGGVDDHEIRCDWVLTFEREPDQNSSESEYVYTCLQARRPAGYDLEQNQISGKTEAEQDYYDRYGELPADNKLYTYHIQDHKISVSYDGRRTWTEVPIDTETLCTVADGNSVYNELAEGSYLITPEKTAFLFGGTPETRLSVLISEDQGNTWNTYQVDNAASVEDGLIDGVRLRFLSFPTDDTGYIVATTGRTMSWEGTQCFKTTDGGKTWTCLGWGPRESLLHSAGFVDENTGFLSYRYVEGAESCLYRTEDGGQTWEPVILPDMVVLDVQGKETEVFIQPETPVSESEGKLSLLVGQGENGDYQGGACMAQLISEDLGKTWTFSGTLIEPANDEPG